MIKVLAISHAYCEPFTRAGLVESKLYPEFEYTIVIPIHVKLNSPDGFRVLSKEYSDIHPLRTFFNFHQSVRAYGAGLWYLLKAMRPDIVFINNEPWSTTAFQTVLFCKLLGLRSKLIVYTCENLRRKYQWPFNWLEKYVLRNIEAVCILPQFDGKEMLEHKEYKGRIYYLPLAADTSHFKKGDSSVQREKLGFIESDLVIGFAGRLVEEKGIQTMVQTLPLLEERYKLLMIGNGPYKDKLAALSRALGVENRIQFVNAVLNNELPLFLNAMDIFVLPSLTTENWKEQFGRVLVEAMACEVPVIGSSSGEIPVVIGDAGVVFNEGDAKDLSSKIEQLANDNEVRARLGFAGRKRVLEHFDTKVVMEKTVTMYRELFNENTR